MYKTNKVQGCPAQHREYNWSIIYKNIEILSETYIILYIKFTSIKKISKQRQSPCENLYLDGHNSCTHDSQKVGTTQIFTN